MSFSKSSVPHYQNDISKKQNKTKTQTFNATPVYNLSIAHHWFLDKIPNFLA